MFSTSAEMYFHRFLLVAFLKSRNMIPEFSIHKQFWSQLLLWWHNLSVEQLQLS